MELTQEISTDSSKVNEVKEKCTKLLQLKQEIYGRQFVTVKSHYTLHAAEQLSLVGPLKLVWSFPGERDNKWYKSVATNGKDMAYWRLRHSEYRKVLRFGNLGSAEKTRNGRTLSLSGSELEVVKQTIGNELMKLTERE